MFAHFVTEGDGAPCHVLPGVTFSEMHHLIGRQRYGVLVPAALPQHAIHRLRNVSGVTKFGFLGHGGVRNSGMVFYAFTAFRNLRGQPEFSPGLTMEIGATTPQPFIDALAAALHHADPVEVTFECCDIGNNEPQLQTFADRLSAAGVANATVRAFRGGIQWNCPQAGRPMPIRPPDVTVRGHPAGGVTADAGAQAADASAPRDW